MSAHSLPFHNPVKRGLAVDNILIRFQWNASERDAFVVVQSGLVFVFGLVFAVAHLLNAVIGAGQFASGFHLQPIGLHAFVIDMQFGKVAAGLLEGTKIYGAFDAGDAGSERMQI